MRAVVVLAMILPAFGVAQINVPPYIISTIAGFGLGDGGPAKQAELIHPIAVVADTSGNIYVAEANRVRKVSADGTISTYVGTGVYGFSGDGGLATAADLQGVEGLAIDKLGNLYISTEFRIRRVSPSGIITTIAGSSSQGSGGDGQLAVNATLSLPSGLTVDSGGSLYIADANIQRVRKITPDGRINTVAGNGSSGTPADGAVATASPLSSPSGVAVDTSGSLYIGGGASVYKVDPSGIITTIAGNGQFGYGGDGQSARSAMLYAVTGIAVDSAGTVWVADSGNHRIRKISGGIITTVAGNGIAGYGGDGGAATVSQLAYPKGVALGQSSNLYIADQDNQRVRMVTPSGTISTIAGGAQFAPEGGPASGSALALPSAVATDKAGNIYVSESGNDRVRKITPEGTITTVAGTGVHGFSGDGKAALLAQLNLNSLTFLSGGALAIDSKSDLYIADDNNYIIRMVAPDGTIKTVAGSFPPGSGGDGGPATSAQLAPFLGLAIDAQGVLYMGDVLNHNIRTVAPNGIIGTLVASNGWALAVDKTGNLYFGNGTRIQMISPGGTITDVAGGGTSSEDGIPATSARFNNYLTGLAVDGSGNLFISDGFVDTSSAGVGVAHRIRMVTPSGMITTIAGTGVFGFNGDSGLATSAQLASPAGIAVDSAGNVYVADLLNHRIRKLTPDSKIQLKIDGGNLQSAVAGSTLPNPLAVQLVSGIGAGLPNSTVTFKVVSGSASLSANTATTGRDGRASVSVTLGNSSGTVTVTASASGIPPVTFTATSTAASTSSSVPSIATGGVITSSNFGGAPLIAPGDWIEIYGSKLSDTTRPWGGGDFSGDQAPTSLDGVQVLVNGKTAFVQLVSPGQINAQVPDGIGGGSATVVVKNSNGSSVAATVSSAGRAPALLAPPAFRSGNRQYAVALFPDNTTFVGPPGLVSGATFQPAQAGDHIVLYGVGFGPTNPAIPAGQIAGEANSLPNVVVKLGDAAATVEYAGLAAGSVGLYQFNVVVPPGITGDAPLTFTVDGVALTQTLYVALR